MEAIETILKTITGMTVEEIEGHIADRGAAIDVLRAEQKRMIPFLDAAINRRHADKRAPENLTQTLTAGGR